MTGFDPSPRLVERRLPACRARPRRRRPGRQRRGSSAWARAADAVVSVFAAPEQRPTSAFTSAADDDAAAWRRRAAQRPRRAPPADGGAARLDRSWRAAAGAIAAAGRRLVPRAALPAPDPLDATPRLGTQRRPWMRPGTTPRGSRPPEQTRTTVTASPAEARARLFRDTSPDAWFERRQEPDTASGAPPAPSLGEAAWPAVRDDSLAVLREQNEDPAAFAVTSGYVVICAAR